MTIPVNDRRIQYTATAGQTIFPYDFKIDANTEITVLQTINATSATNTLTLTTEYTVSGVGDAGGGNITLVTGASLNDIITIVGNTPLSRVTDFNQAGDFLVSDLNNQLDKITSILQENKTNTDRAIRLKNEDTTSVLEIPTATNRASKFLAFDASGNAIASAGTAGVVVSSFMETVLDDTTAAAARTTLDVYSTSQTEQKANSLTAITTLQDADQFIVADNSDNDNSKKITKANLRLAIAPDATTTTQGISYLNKPVTIANNTDDANNDIDFSAGVMNFTDGSGQAVATALTKQLDASWVVGTNAGGLFSGSKAADTLYYCHSIWNPTTSTYGAGFDTSSTAANRPSGYTNYEKLGGIVTDGSSNIFALFGNNQYISSLQTITLAGQLVLAHGLGRKPHQIAIYLKCTTTDGGYSVGDEVMVNPAINDSGDTTRNRGFSLVTDGTNIIIRNATLAFTLIRKDTGAAFVITTTSWKLFVKASI